MGNANPPEQNSTCNYNVKTMLYFIATRFPLNQVTDASKCYFNGVNKTESTRVSLKSAVLRNVNAST